MVQYIAVSGGACDVLSIFRQFAGEISFIKITKNDNERVRVMLLCVCVIWSANSSSATLTWANILFTIE